MNYHGCLKYMTRGPIDSLNRELDEQPFFLAHPMFNSCVRISKLCKYVIIAMGTV